MRDKLLFMGTSYMALVTAQAFEDQRLQDKARQDYMDKMQISDPQHAVYLRNMDMAEAERKLAAQSDRSLEDTSPQAAATVPYQRPEGMPEGTRDWRANMAALAPQVAESPLPTRQLRRMAAHALSKSLASVSKVHHRHAAKMQKKRDRATAAHALHSKISSHVPSKVV